MSYTMQLYIARRTSTRGLLRRLREARVSSEPRTIEEQEWLKATAAALRERDIACRVPVRRHRT